MQVVRFSEHPYTPYIYMPPYVWIPPIYLDTPICLDVLHMVECPPYIWIPPYVWMPSMWLNTPHTHAPCSPINLYISRGYLHIKWGWGHLYTLIECSDAITRIIYKKYYKFVHVGKHKYLNKTPFDL